MNIYDRISKMSDESGTYDEKMYRILNSDKYASGEYEKHKLGEGMEVVNQVIWGVVETAFSAQPQFENRIRVDVAKRTARYCR